MAVHCILSLASSQVRLEMITDRRCLCTTCLGLEPTAPAKFLKVPIRSSSKNVCCSLMRFVSDFRAIVPRDVLHEVLHAPLMLAQLRAALALGSGPLTNRISYFIPLAWTRASMRNLFSTSSHLQLAQCLKCVPWVSSATSHSTRAAICDLH